MTCENTTLKSKISTLKQFGTACSFLNLKYQSTLLFSPSLIESVRVGRTSSSSRQDFHTSILAPLMMGHSTQGDVIHKVSVGSGCIVYSTGDSCSTEP